MHLLKGVIIILSHHYFLHIYLHSITQQLHDIDTCTAYFYRHFSIHGSLRNRHAAQIYYTYIGGLGIAYRQILARCTQYGG